MFNFFFEKNRQKPEMVWLSSGKDAEILYRGDTGEVIGEVQLHHPIRGTMLYNVRAWGGYLHWLPFVSETFYVTKPSAKTALEEAFQKWNKANLPWRKAIPR